MPKRSETIDEINERTRQEIAAAVQRVKEAAQSGDEKKVAALDETTKALIRELPATERNGKYAQLKKARETEPLPAGEIEPTADYAAVPGVSDLVTQGTQALVDGVNLHLKASVTAREVARIILAMRVRLPNSAGDPDLRAESYKARAAAHDMYKATGKQLSGDAFDVDVAVKKLERSVQNAMSDVRAEYLRSLDTDKKEAARFKAIIKAAGRGAKPSEAVAAHYDFPLKGKNEIAREKYQRDRSAAQSIADEEEGGHPVERGVLAIQRAGNRLVKVAKKAEGLDPKAKAELKKHVDATIVNLTSVSRELG
ncbi:hypothetical protein [Streptomyces sp. Isolate_219]|uniref:hypothetical protein n=1 Tax=Streptomyces sp. Isolate_219 TaxID=2950110 RepID=UPI0021C7422C|nr:hypothetical protein [Streptomyces sp. Isolate_219]MCR8576454.1 hypothetical protein [Streptomyces sp. Isolate_219]